MHDIDHKHEDGQMSDVEKLSKRIEHWIKHNDEHRKIYLEWAERTLQMNMKDVSDALKRVAQLADEQNELFVKMLKSL